MENYQTKSVERSPRLAPASYRHKDSTVIQETIVNKSQHFTSSKLQNSLQVPNKERKKIKIKGAILKKKRQVEEGKKSQRLSKSNKSMENLRTTAQPKLRHVSEVTKVEESTPMKLSEEPVLASSLLEKEEVKQQIDAEISKIYDLEMPKLRHGGQSLQELPKQQTFPQRAVQKLNRVSYTDQYLTLEQLDAEEEMASLELEGEYQSYDTINYPQGNIRDDNPVRLQQLNNEISPQKSENQLANFMARGQNQVKGSMGTFQDKGLILVAEKGKLKDKKQLKIQFLLPPRINQQSDAKVDEKQLVTDPVMDGLNTMRTLDGDFEGPGMETDEHVGPCGEVDQVLNNSRMIKNQQTIFQRKKPCSNSKPSKPSSMHTRQVSLSIGMKDHLTDKVKRASARAIDDVQRSSTFQKDFKIVPIEPDSTDHEFILAKKGFQYLSKDALSALQQHCKSRELGLISETITNLDFSQNQLQNLDGSLFMHLGSQCAFIKVIKADYNQISTIQHRIKDCKILQVLSLKHNNLGAARPTNFLPIELYSSQSLQTHLQELYLSNNNIRDIPWEVNLLVSLRILDLANNKLRSLNTEISSKSVSQQSQRRCAISELVNLQELYLQGNRLSDLPAIFDFYTRLKILGLDWFTYLDPSCSLPQIVEDPRPILILQSACLKLREKRIQNLTFKTFARSFSPTYNIDTRFEDNRTALHLAVLKDDHAMVFNLLKDGADPNLQDNYDYSPLALAIESDKRGLANLILQKTDQKIDSSVLNLAIEKMNLDLIIKLLSKGVCPNGARDPRTGEQSLHILIVKLSMAIDYEGEIKDRRKGTSRHFGKGNVLFENSSQQEENKLDREDTNADEYDRFLQEIQENNLMMTKPAIKPDSEGKCWLYSESEDAQGVRPHATLNDGCNHHLNMKRICLQIFELLVKHGVNFNQKCKQNYSPLHLAIRLGNPQVVAHLLAMSPKPKQLYQEDGVRDGIDINAKCGVLQQNTGMHMAATRSNYEMVKLLDQYGADIFARNRENKTCSQQFNNILQMLKFLKKIEKKQFILRKVWKEYALTQAIESRILVTHSTSINTGQHRTFDSTLQRIKTENQKIDELTFDDLENEGRMSKRNSIFSSSSQRGRTPRRAASGSLARANQEKKKKKDDKKQIPQKLSMFDFLPFEQKESKAKMPEHQPVLMSGLPSLPSRPNPLVQTEDDGKRSINLKHTPKIVQLKNMNRFLTRQGSGVLHRQLTRQDSANVLETDRLGPNRSPNEPTQEIIKKEHRGDYNDMVQLKRHNYSMAEGFDQLSMFNGNSETQNSKHGQPVSSVTVSKFNLDTLKDSQSQKNQNHGNIYFFKEQMFDKERLKLQVYNKEVQYKLVKHTPDSYAVCFKKLRDLCEDTCTPQVQFTFAQKELQEIKLAAQLRQNFNSRLKTHISVLADMIENLHKLKQSNKLIEVVLELAEVALVANGLAGLDGKQREKTVLTALENQNQSINCPQWVKDEIDDIVERTLGGEETGRREYSCEDFSDALPSEKMQKYNNESVNASMLVDSMQRLDESGKDESSRFIPHEVKNPLTRQLDIHDRSIDSQAKVPDARKMIEDEFKDEPNYIVDWEQRESSKRLVQNFEILTHGHHLNMSQKGQPTFRVQSELLINEQQFTDSSHQILSQERSPSSRNIQHSFHPSDTVDFQMISLPDPQPFQQARKKMHQPFILKKANIHFFKEH